MRNSQRGGMLDRLRILVIEDRRLVAECLGSVLTAAGAEVDIVVEPTEPSVFEAIARHRPSVAIVAAGIGEGSLTERVVGSLCEHGIPAIVMSGSPSRLRLARCVAEGAVGIVDRHGDITTLINLLRETQAERSALPLNLRYQLADELRAHRAQLSKARLPFTRLTPREQTVLGLLMAGFDPKSIAESSFVSISTVRSQIKSILSKLGVRSQVQAVALASRCHWSPAGSPIPEFGDDAIEVAYHA